MTIHLKITVLLLSSNSVLNLDHGFRKFDVLLLTLGLLGHNTIHFRNKFLFSISQLDSTLSTHVKYVSRLHQSVGLLQLNPNNSIIQLISSTGILKILYSMYY